MASSPSSVTPDDEHEKLATSHVSPPRAPKAMMPRGCRFRDLNEAHRNITGRSISSTVSSTVSNGSSNNEARELKEPKSRAVSLQSAKGRQILSGTDQIDEFEEISLEETRELPRQDGCENVANPDSVRDAASSNDLISFSSDEDRKKEIQEAKKDEKDEKEKKDKRGKRDKRDKKSNDTSSSPGSMHRVYPSQMDHAASQRSHGEGHGQESQSETRSATFHSGMSLSIRDGATSRPGFRTGETVHTMFDSRGSLQESEAGGLTTCLESPQECHELRDLPYPPYQQDQQGTPLNGQVVSRESLLFPMPLRVQSLNRDLREVRKMQARSSMPANNANSPNNANNADDADDSDEDPFRYDKNPYKIFLHPSKEREVSAALKHISNLSSHSQATLYSQEEEAVYEDPDYRRRDSHNAHAAHISSSHDAHRPPPVFHSNLQPPPIPQKYLAETPQQRQHQAGPLPHELRELSPALETTGGFYDTSLTQPNWEVNRSRLEVKVVLRDGATPQQPVGNPFHGNQGNVQQLPGHSPRRAAPGREISRLKHQDRNDRHDNINSSNTLGERDDWETVATSGVGFGSTRRSFPLVPLAQQLCHSSRLSREFKTTGSSIADVSDESIYSADSGSQSIHNVPFVQYASTDRIVQPSSGSGLGTSATEEQETSEESLRIQNVNGIRVPIIKPKQRTHRVNGLTLTPGAPPAMVPSETAASLARKMSAPFRQLSTSRRRQSRRFSPMPLQVLKSRPVDKARARRFEFRNSQASSMLSDGGRLYTKAANMAEAKKPTAVDARHPANPMLAQNGGNRAGDSLQRESGSSQSSGDTTHSFSFQLISLPEAARLHAMKRNSELLDTQAATGRRMPPLQPVRPLAPAVHGVNGANGANATDCSLDTATTAVNTSWESTTPFGSSATRVLQSAATMLRLDSLGSRLNQHRQSARARQPGSDWDCRHGHRYWRQRERRTPAHPWQSSTPRLYPWDYPYQCPTRKPVPRQRQQQPQQQQQRGGDAELHELAVIDQGGWRYRSSNLYGNMDYGERGLPQDAEAFLSDEARRRRQTWFLFMLAISVLLPFLSVVVYLGQLDGGLSWYTRGEVARLSRSQRRAILTIMVLQFALWPCVLVYVIWQVQQ